MTKLIPRPWRSWLPRRSVFAQYDIREWPAVFGSAGLQSWLAARRSYSEEATVFATALERGWDCLKAGRRTRLTADLPQLGHVRVELRRGASDFAVFQQCLVEQHYRLAALLALRALPGDRTLSIVDAGANIGLSAIYFSRMLPNSKLWCLEPSTDSRGLCAVNLCLNGLRDATVLAEALWSGTERLELTREHRDGRSWSIAVRAASAATQPVSEVRGIGIETLLRQIGVAQLDVLKLDVEGAEEELFRDPIALAGWLPRVNVIAIEVHRPEGLDIVLPALAGHGFTILPYGELLVGARGATAEIAVGAAAAALRSSRS